MREIIHSIAFPLVTELLYPTPLSAHVFSGLFGPTFFFLMVSQAVSPLSLTPRRFRVLKVSIMAVLPIWGRGSAFADALYIFAEIPRGRWYNFGAVKTRKLFFQWSWSERWFRGRGGGLWSWILIDRELDSGFVWSGNIKILMIFNSQSSVRSLSQSRFLSYLTTFLISWNMWGIGY